MGNRLNGIDSGISLEQAVTSFQNELSFSLSHWERVGVRV